MLELPTKYDSRKAKQRAHQFRRVERYRLEGLPPGVQHGKLSTYTNYACRCAPCKAVRKAYDAGRRKAS